MSKKKTRRDFIVIASYSMGAVGAGAAIWPIINQMNPAADTLAMASTEVNIGALEIGQALTVKWRGKPVFIRRRTVDEINDTRTVAIDTLRDPQSDEDRVQKDEWLVVMGVCTHLGCVPLGQKIGDGKGDYGDGFVHVMDPIMMLQEELERVLHLKTLKSLHIALFQIMY